jgi:Fic family protein
VKVLSYQKRYSSEKWYSALRREQNEREQTESRYNAEQQLSLGRDEAFLEESLLFNKLKEKNPLYIAENCARQKSQKTVKVACRYLEGFQGLKEYKSMAELARKYDISESSMRKRLSEIVEILDCNVKKFTKGTRTKK